MSHKRLIVCCDGTWKHEDDGEPSNVARLFSALAEQGEDGVPQRGFYQHGIGATPGYTGLRRWWDRMAGGGFGWGLDGHIKQIYQWLIEQYTPGDELWFFGFSRGAYTARSTAGLIRNCGLLRGDHAGRIDEAMQLYRGRGPESHPDASRAVGFREKYAHEVESIAFLGLWDTVGTLGIPGWWPVVSRLFRRRFEFHDVRLSRRVQAAYHALAIDERRRTFGATLWDNPEIAEREHVRQVWLAGVHSDVGGGYFDRGLADISLEWMIDRAEGHGLALDADKLAALQLKPAWDGELHDSRWGLHRVPGVGHAALRDRPITAAYAQSIHPMAEKRHREDENYRPPNLAEALQADVPVGPRG